VNKVQETERQMHEFIRTEHADMRDKLVAEAALTDEIEGMLKRHWKRLCRVWHQRANGERSVRARNFVTTEG
jgi:hypothetical protein